MNERPLTCEQVIACLMAYLDGEVEGVSPAEIERHLARCRDCFSRAEFELRLNSRLIEAGTATAPDGLRQRIGTLIARF